MFKKLTLLMLPLLLIVSFWHYGVNVRADDDEKYENYSKKQKYEDHDDDDDDDYEHDDDDDDIKKYEDDHEHYSDSPSIEPNSYWNIWTREPIVALNGDLPIGNAQEVKITLNQKDDLFYMIPQNGQLLVSGEKFAQFLGAKAKFYHESKILVMTKANEELIVRAGTNAAYENMTKTPMPSKALYYEKSIYLPISVVANALGYRVHWDSKKETITLTLIN